LGGEQQMLAIARRLMTDPEVLIIDELSSGLAPVFVYQLFFEAIPRQRYRLSRLARARSAS
jgi:ABC-type branched-subunit amino acid transport system ATPase component